jgi:hypothetical protein
MIILDWFHPVRDEVAMLNCVDAEGSGRFLDLTGTLSNGILFQCKIGYFGLLY